MSCNFIFSAAILPLLVYFKPISGFVCYNATAGSADYFYYSSQQGGMGMGGMGGMGFGGNGYDPTMLAQERARFEVTGCAACARGKVQFTAGGNVQQLYVWGCLLGNSMMGGGLGPSIGRVDGLQPGMQVISRPGGGGGYFGSESGRYNNQGYPGSNYPGYYPQQQQQQPGQGYFGNSFGGLPPQPVAALGGGVPVGACIDGSFQGYSNALGANIYMCTCCSELCNLSLTCQTFNSASTLAATIVFLLSSIAFSSWFST